MQRIESINDPRVAAYRNLPDRTLRGESVFVAEGLLLTQRLLESSHETESVFVTDDYAEEFRRRVPAGVPVYVAAEELLLEVVGFNFHRGALALGRRRLSQSVEQLLASKALSEGIQLVICPEITKPENMGLVFRTAAGFGLDGVVLGERCCDPFSRRSMRVSMGAVLNVPYVKSQDLLSDLKALRERWDVELWATVLDATADRIDQVVWPRRIGVLMGNEFEGLGMRWLAACQRKVTIPVTSAVDSLNLGVAAGIFLYEMTHPRQGRKGVGEAAK